MKALLSSLLTAVLFAGCTTQKTQSQRFHQVLSELLLSGHSFEANLRGYEDGPMSRTVSNISLCAEIADLLETNSSNWRKIEQIPIMLTGADIHISGVAHTQAAVSVVAPDVVVFTDHAGSCYYGKTPPGFWKTIWSKLEDYRGQ